MPKLNVHQIKERARAIIAEKPEGIRFTPLIARIREEAPETPRHTISTSIWDLHSQFPNEISKPSRGLFKPIDAAGDDIPVVSNTEQIAPTGAKIKESDFYEPFADWLKNDLDEVT